MPSGTSSLPDTQFSQGQVQVITDNQQVIYSNSVFSHNLTDSTTAVIYVCLRFCQHDLLSADNTCAQQGLTLMLFHGNVMAPGKLAYTVKTDIMTIMRIFFTGISYANNQLHFT